jgi:hypothetical protein
MTHVSINSIGSKFILTDSSGEPITPTMYSSVRTARQAATKLKHTYTSDTPKAKSSASKAEVSNDKVDELWGYPLDTLNALRDKGMIPVKAAPKVISKRNGKLKLDWSAGDHLCAHIFDKNGDTVPFGRLVGVLKRANYKNLTDAERDAKSEKQAKYRAKTVKIAESKTAKRKQVSVPAIVPTPMAPIVSDLSDADRQLQNAICKVNGFPRFRECQHAASHPDHSRHGEALIVMTILAATMESAKPNRSQLEKPFAKFG